MPEKTSESALTATDRMFDEEGIECFEIESVSNRILGPKWYLRVTHSLIPGVLQIKKYYTFDIFVFKQLKYAVER